MSSEQTASSATPTRPLLTGVPRVVAWLLPVGVAVQAVLAGQSILPGDWNEQAVAASTSTSAGSAAARPPLTSCKGD